MSILQDKIAIEVAEAELTIQKKMVFLPPLYRWIILAYAIALIPGYFLTRFISYHYWQKQNAAYLISAKGSFTNANEPQIGTASITKIGDGLYSAAIQVSNQNLELSLDKTPYTFNFYNKDKQIIKIISDTLFLLPNQTKFLVVPKIQSNEPIVSGEVVFPQKLVWQKRLSIPTVKLTPNKPQTYNQIDPIAFAVEGNVQNNSAYQLKKVHITFLLYDGSGNLLAASQRDEFDVRPRELRAYKQLWPNIYSTSVTRTQVYADTDSLDTDNISVPTAPSNSASNLGSQ